MIDHLQPALNHELGRDPFEAQPVRDDLLKIRPALRYQAIHPQNYVLTFRHNLECHIISMEKLRDAVGFKETAMKVLFVAFLVLGVVCASSFFLLPLLGSIAGALGLSVAATKMAWQTIFMGGGLLAGLSFIPRRFVKGFQDEKNEYQQKIETLKTFLIENDFKGFLAKELSGKYLHPELIASSSDFAELYYLLNTLQVKKFEAQEFENELANVRQMLAQLPEAMPNELETKIQKIEKKIQEMNREILELENETNEIRAILAELDREHIPE